MTVDLRRDALRELVVEGGILPQLKDTLMNLGCHFHVAVLLLELVYVVSFEVCVG